MSARKNYKTAGVGARMANAFDAGPMATGGVRVPHGTLTAIDCPDCPSLAGKQCVSRTGKTLTQVHISRRRMAMRKYHEDREAQETKLDG